jgi:hypothetical protein
MAFVPSTTARGGNVDVAEALDRLPMVELHGLLVLRLPVLCVPVPVRGCPTRSATLRRRSELTFLAGLSFRELVADDPEMDRT